MNKNEIIFFENNIKDEKDYIKIFIYLIDNQSPGKFNNGNSNLQIKSYPLLFKLKKDTKIDEFVKIVFLRLISLDCINEDLVKYYDSKKAYHKILDINLIHGKETKKVGFFSKFSNEDICKYCNKSNDRLLYCSIHNFAKKNKTLLSAFNNFKEPIILVATSECFNTYNEEIFINNLDKTVKRYTKKIHLKDCLDLYGQNIELKDDDMWYCSKCKKHQVSKQKLQIYKAPRYLIIQIKRFNIKKSYGGSSTFYGEKNDTFVSYPVNDLNLSDYIVGPEKDKNNKYDLYGVVQHFGSLDKGHYTAICKNNESWICYEDSNIDIVKNPVTKDAYILFYKRKDLENNDNCIDNIDNRKRNINQDNKTNSEIKKEKETPKGNNKFQI